jgi:hypothetical protein
MAGILQRVLQIAAGDLQTRGQAKQNGGGQGHEQCPAECGAIYADGTK